MSDRHTHRSQSRVSVALARTAPRAPHALVVLLVARCINRLGGFSMAFLGVHLAQDLGAALRTTGLVLAVFGVCTIPSRLLGGALSDRLGASRTMTIGLLGCAGAQLVIAAAPSLAWAVVGAVLLGLSFEIIEPPSQALVAELVPAERLPSAYALVWGSLAVAGVLAGLLAAATTATVGLRWLFVIDALTCLACAALVAWQLPDTRTVRDVGVVRTPQTPAGMPCRPVTRSSSPRVRGPLAVAARDPRLLRHTAVGTAFALVTMTIVFALPLTVPARGWSNSATGIVMAAEALTALAAQPLVSRVGRRTGGAAGRHRAVRAGALVLLAGLGGAALAGQLMTFAVSLAVASAGSVLLLGNLQAGAAALAPDGGRAAYLAVFGLSWGLATTAAPLLVTRLLVVGDSAPWWAAAGLSLLLLGARPELAAERRQL